MSRKSKIDPETSTAGEGWLVPTGDTATAVWGEGQVLPGQSASAGGDAAGQIHHKVHDRFEEYVYVTRDDLREVKTIGWLQQGLAGLGTFFFSGAFWLLAELVAHQETGKFEFTAWMAVCVLSMFFGAALAISGWIMFGLKQKRLDKYFPKDVDANNPR